MIPAGTAIICAKRHPVGVVSTDIADGSPVHPRWIMFEAGQQIQAGAPKVCQVCGKPWSLEKSVYTPGGWVPVEPYIERVPPRGMRR